MRSLLAAVLLAVSIAGSQTEWKADPYHSSVEFTVAHMVVSEVKGHFTDFAATLTQKEEDFSNSSVDVVIKTASINTSMERRDNHLRSADFFDAQKFPEITFRSTNFVATGGSTYAVTGDLTMHGITRSVVLTAEMRGIIKNREGRSVAGFRATGSLNRYDYGLQWNRAVDAGGVLVGEHVDIEIAVELIEQK